MNNWNFKYLFFSFSIIALLDLSWFFPPTRILWDILDQKVFDLLNSWIHHSRFWQNFWAFTGHRLMDWIHDGLMFLFFFFSIKKASGEVRKKKVAELIFTILFIGFTISLVNGIFFPEFIHMPRRSPTMVDKTAFRLSSVIDWIVVKDHSRKSFPGDHATTAILFTWMIFSLMGWRKGVLALLYAIFFCLPRLITGAHWFTDVLIGSASIAALASMAAFGTPLARMWIGLIERGLQKLFRRRLEQKVSSDPPSS